MPAATDSISPRLARAVDSEHDALTHKLRRLERERAQLRERLAAVERKIQTADERLVLLAQLRSSAEDLPARPVSARSDRQLLVGAAIRMTAVALVRDLPEGEQALHYRAWLELLERAGFEVGGQKPAATFLSQISRSPVIRRTTRPGHYEIDRQAPARLRRQLAAMREELSTNPDQSELVHLSGVRERRAAIVRKMERTQRELEEATATLTLPVAQVARSA